MRKYTQTNQFEFMLENVFLILGTGIIGLVCVQLGLTTYTSILGLGRERAQRRLSEQLLWERIELAKAMRARQAQEKTAWNGYRKFVVERKVCEADNICSFYLVPHDRKPLTPFKPGQYLTFRLTVPGQQRPVIRCYSLSDAPHAERYRISVKRVFAPADCLEAPHGVCSNYFHDHVSEGQILDVKAPNGHFTLDPSEKRPAVLIGGGVGVTPLVSMLKTVAQADSKREVTLFYGVRHGGEHMQRESMRELADSHPNVRLVVCYSDPRSTDVEGPHYDHRGHISVELMKQYLGTNNYVFYVCGPPPMMKAITEQLRQWDVPKEDILTEAFGPASVQARKPAAAPAKQTQPESESKATICFDKTGKQCSWTSGAGTLLTIADEMDVAIDRACLAGSCGTCQTAVKSGEVVYDAEPEWEVEQGCCLPCIGYPKGKVVLDA